MDARPSFSFCENKLAHCAPALRLLLDGFEYACDSDHSLWEFAVSYDEICQLGLHSNDIRWLIARGWILHGHECHELNHDSRHIRPNKTTNFAKTSCFVLTETGKHVAQSHGPRSMHLKSISLNECETLVSPILSKQHSHPEWNVHRHELLVNQQLIKRYRWPAENQEAVLNAFQEEGWPARIDDPIPPQSNIDPKRRLADTIKCLNRNHLVHLVRFRGDGTGEGVLWDFIPIPHPGDSLDENS